MSVGPGQAYTAKVVTLIKDRAVFVQDLEVLGDYFFKAPEAYNEKASRKQWKPETGVLMTELVAVLSDIEDFSAGNIETLVKQWITAKEVGFGKVMPPFRLALAGDMKGPHLFDIAAVLGKEETINRIKRAVEALG